MFSQNRQLSIKRLTKTSKVGIFGLIIILTQIRLITLHIVNENNIGARKKGNNGDAIKSFIFLILQ